MDPAEINAMLGRMSGAVRVSAGGVEGWGNDAHAVMSLAGTGIAASSPSVVVASEYFPGIGLDRADGEAFGITQPIVVGDYMWTVRDLEPGEAPGEVRVLLSNRRPLDE